MTSAEETGDYTGYADKPATDMQQRFIDWTKEKLALTFTSKKEEAAFDEGMRLGTALRMPFQRSPENQAESNMVRANRGKAEAEPAPAKAAKATAPAKATKAAPAKKAAKAAAPAPEETEPEETDEQEAPAAPAKRTGRPAARRTRAAASTASAPF